MKLDHAAGGRLLDEYVRAFTESDGEAWAALFSEDVDYRPGTFGPSLVGRNAVRAYLLRASLDREQIELTIERHWVVRPTVLAAFHGGYVRSADRARVRVAGFLAAEVAADGRIERYREWSEARVAPAE